MSTVPNPNNGSSCPPECRQNWQRASDPVEHVKHCPSQINDSAEFIEVADGHRVFTCCGKLDDGQHKNFCPYFRLVVGDLLEADERFRAGYVEGYLDAITVVRNMDRETVAALAGLADRRDSLTDDEREAIEVAAQSPVDRLLDDTHQRWIREHQKWRGEVLGCPEWCTAVHTIDEHPDYLHGSASGS